MLQPAAAPASSASVLVTLNVKLFAPLPLSNTTKYSVEGSRLVPLGAVNV